MAEEERRPFSVDLVMDGNAVAVEPWHGLLPEVHSPGGSPLPKRRQGPRTARRSPATLPPQGGTERRGRHLTYRRTAALATQPMRDRARLARKTASSAGETIEARPARRRRHWTPEAVGGSA
jgi:hypothetical protein